MPLILAVEPDRRQAAHLTHIVRQRVGAELILADTTELALASIGNRVPDLILVPALMSPQDDAALAAALRVIATAAHVQMLTTPLFATAIPAPRARGVLAAFRRSKAKTSIDGCDPAEFAQQISSYLESAAEQREAAEYLESPAADTLEEAPYYETILAQPAAAPEPVAAMAPEPIVSMPIEEAILEEPIVEEAIIEEPIVEEAIVEEPVIEEPVLEEPIVEEAIIEEPVEPIAAAPLEPVFEEATFEEPIAEEPIAVEPIVQEPEPLAAAAEIPVRRIGFILHDEELVAESAPLVSEPAEVEMEPVVLSAAAEIAPAAEEIVRPVAPIEEPVEDAIEEPLEALTEPLEVVEVFAEPLEEIAEAIAQPAFEDTIELVEVDLEEDAAIEDSTADEFDIPTIEIGAIELEDTPAAMEAIEFAPPAPSHVIEIDALKEFAATVEAMTVPVQETDEGVAAAAIPEPITFEDFLPPREPVEPSPLGAWRSWTAMEGLAAETAEAPVPAHVMERAVERPAEGTAERPEWVQLVESLRIDVERRRNERPFAAAVPARTPTRPVQDEWGLFDPAQCGFAALLEKLDEITHTTGGDSRPRPSA